MPPHSGQAHLARSRLTKARMPEERILSRFSAMLMPYFVR